MSERRPDPAATCAPHPPARAGRDARFEAQLRALVDGRTSPTASPLAHLARAAGEVGVTDDGDDAKSRLRHLARWPLARYAGLDPSLRVRVLRWLTDATRKRTFRGPPRVLCDLDQRHAWTEQWFLALLHEGELSADELPSVAARIAKRDASVDAHALLRALAHRDRTGRSFVSWLNHLQGAKAWDALLEATHDALHLRPPAPARTEVWTLRVRAHLARAKGASDPEKHAREAALDLWRAEAEGVLPEAEALRGAVYPYLAPLAPAQRLDKRVVSKVAPVLAPAQRVTDRLLRGASALVGGRRGSLPATGVLEATAPRLATGEDMAGALDGNPALTQELQRAAGLRPHSIEAVVVGIGVGAGGLWTLSCVDDRVLDAIRASTAGRPDRFRALQESGLASGATEGARRRLLGYVAEQDVALRLTRAGHDVQIPDSPTTPGYDLLVDGQRVQVKCTMSASNVHEHLERWPDIPVIVNRELAAEFEGDPRVWVDEELSHGATLETLNDTLAAFEQLDAFPWPSALPLLSLPMAALRNTFEDRANHTPDRTWARRVTVDATARAAGGAVVGALAAALAAPLGPGAMVLGGAAGTWFGHRTGKDVADAYNRAPRCERTEDAVRELADFAAWFREHLLAPRVASLARRRDRVEGWARDPSVRAELPAHAATFAATAWAAHGDATALDAWLDRHLRSGRLEQTAAGRVALERSRGFFHVELDARQRRALDALRA